MTKAKTTAPEAETPTTEGQDTVAGEAETTDQPGADDAAAEEAAKAEADRLAAEEAAKAEADHLAAEEAEAKAKADAQAKADAAAKSKRARARKLDLPTLDYCANHIATRNFTGLRAELVEELTTHHGLKVETDDDTGQIRLGMQGISIDPADTLETALANWSNAARRHIAQATA